ncbi:hypothetical protein [Salipaludibacillus sp. CF4.18]|uniref:hypothetical protein n=1 Tax=Salipaludibacillus sp. CF4.18 TaxID=3373081 RepID=UPI003EE6426C
MLRRVSDRITVELDSKQLDEANEVQRYRFKDIEVRMNGLKSQVEIVKDEFYKVVGYKELEAEWGVLGGFSGFG